MNVFVHPVAKCPEWPAGGGFRRGSVVGWTLSSQNWCGCNQLTRTCHWEEWEDNLSFISTLSIHTVVRPLCTTTHTPCCRHCSVGTLRLTLNANQKMDESFLFPSSSLFVWRFMCEARLPVANTSHILDSIYNWLNDEVWKIPICKQPLGTHWCERFHLRGELSFWYKRK